LSPHETLSKHFMVQSTPAKKGASKKKVDSSFFVGKLDATSSSVEYQHIIGGEGQLGGQFQVLLTPKKARTLCEADLQCAGFTYKGAKDLGQKFHMNFFHYIPESAVASAKSSGDWTWTSYKVSRPFVILNALEDVIKKDEFSTSQHPSQDLKDAKDATTKDDLVIYNPISGVQYYFNPMKNSDSDGTSQKKLDLRQYLDMNHQYSKWMIRVNLKTKESLASSKKICLSTNSALSEKDYKQVPKVDCGVKKLQQKYLPVIVNANNDCFANLEFSSAYKNVNLFDAVVNASAWTLPQSKDRAIKRESLLKAGGAYKSGAVHLRATVHDRSALEVKKMIVNGQDLVPPFAGKKPEQEEDLATKLSLRRSPLLFVDYWGQSKSIPLINPPGTSAAYYYIEGEEPMDWILLPTNARSELATMTCNEGGEILSPNLTIHGRTVQRAVLHQGEMIYVPQGWAYIVSTRGSKPTVTLAEARLEPEGIEEAAANLGSQEIHGLKKGLYDEPHWYLWRRFTEILKQRKKNV